MMINLKMRLGKKLTVLFLLIGLMPFFLIGIISYNTAKRSIKHSIVERLLFVREMKKDQIEDYFKYITEQVKLYAKDRMISDAMEEFTAAFFLVEEELGTTYKANLQENDDILRSRYVYQKENTDGLSDNAIELWWPRKFATKLLQYQYIAANPFDIGKKHHMLFASDQSTYTQVHKKYHKLFTDIVEKFYYYDFFLVDAKTGYVVYTAFKELDYATNLLNGPFSKSGLGRAFELALNSTEQDFVTITDYAPYEPSYNKAASFVASPIYKDGQKIGVLIFQTPVGVVDEIMTNHNRWEAVGMGRTGESYIVGDDYKIKNNSRYFVSDKDGFLKELKENGYPTETIDSIVKHKTTSGILEIKNDYMQEALDGKSNYKEDMNNYLKRSVITSYAPLNIKGLTWAIVVEIEMEEAFSSLLYLRNVNVILGVSLIIVVIVLGVFFSKNISSSISRIVNNIATTTSELATTINQQERVASQQTVSVNETTTTMDELSASSRLAAEQAEVAAMGSERAMQLSAEGANIIHKMLDGMNYLKERVAEVADKILNLSEQTNQIGKITSLVNDFANETKMLAMNASVEAVRAGEHGAGFSIVAIEIRKLADESKRSVAQINTLVEEIKKATNNTVMVTEEGTKNVANGMELALKTAEAFNGVVEAVTSSAESAKQISLNVKQQAAAIKQVVEAMNNLNAIAKESANGIGQTKVAIGSLNEVSHTLKEMV
ncbi:MAG: methyl-accepting chemotaxis protein [Candidatus Magnetoovum sp. WYHC-5]|nr:methyl-accepting chemotaxis protein [Candidatus Magnetoovum sp. WYHC-5]